MNSLFHDVRYGIRVLVKNPGFSAVAVLTLTLGIGANTAIFSVVNSVLLQSLPYKDPGRLVWVTGTNAKNDIKSESASMPDFIDWRAQNHSFEDMAALTGIIAPLAGGDEPESVMGGAVSSNYFSVLGVQPRLGRDFTPDDAQPGKDNVLIVTDGFWKSRLGGDRGAIGRVITVGDRPFTVIGVMPPGFLNARPFDYKPMQLWKPLQLVSDNSKRRGDFLAVFGRLKKGVSIGQAHADLDQGVAANLERLYPDTNSGWRTNVESLHDHWVGSTRPALLLLTSAVCFLLLIACANVANLLLARTAAREKEFAVRVALGAGRRRLMQQLLTESILLSAIGGGLGILLASWGVRTLIALSPNLVPLGNAGINRWVLGFTLLVSIATGLLFGVLPALHVSGGSALRALKEGARTLGDGVRGRRTRDLLAAAEIALALVMLIGAGLMIRSFVRLQRVDPGFRTDHLLVAMTVAGPNKYRDGYQVDQFYNKLASEVGGLPGVSGAAAVTITPLM
ncbi:MAG: ABC transporter permease, partial [Blastocatellia bacterium]